MNQKFQDMYKERLCTAEEAVKVIKSGDRVVIGGCTGRPEHVIAAMVANADAYRDVRIMHGLDLGSADYCKEEYSENFIHEALFMSGVTRKAGEQGRVQFIPGHYSELGQWMAEGHVKVNVFMVQVTPPDENGFCSTGLIADFIQEASEAADFVIAQVNRNVPWNSSPDAILHISRLDRIVEFDEPLPTIPEVEITEIERKIGNYCASLVHDGDTIQIGIGGVPDAVCEALSNHKDLGVHTEMIGDGIMKLWEKGVITNRLKSKDKGVMTTVFVQGTQKLYDFVNNNPIIELRRTCESNNAFVIAEQANMVSINSCIEADLMGQVVSGSSGERLISGVGGQADYVRGAMLSRDGKGRSIIAMTSTHTRKGVVSSRIKPHITHGSLVSVNREDVDYIITEYGIAHLRGKNLRERAKAMIAIAHPDFREELTAAMKERYPEA